MRHHRIVVRTLGDYSAGSRHTESQCMSATDPIVTFVMILVIGIVAGILFDRLAGPSWLTRHFTGSARGIGASALVGIAGAFVGCHIAVLLALGGGLLMSVIASAAGAAVVLFAWRLAEVRKQPPARGFHSLRQR